VTVKFAETKVILPYIDHAEEPAKVITPSSAPPAPPKLISLHTAPVEMVTVNAPVPVLEPASKITSSASVGADAPPAPPDVADQLVVLALVQVPVPPLQYLVAITHLRVE